MAIYKNVASQKLAVYAYDSTDASAKTGDAANITAQISKDGAATAATNDVNPTELDATDAPGIYLFDMTQAETNADLVVLYAKSGTANILLEPLTIYTTPGDSTAIAADTIEVGGTAQTANDNGADINTILARIVGTLAAGTHTAQTGDAYAYLGTNLGAIGANATEAGGTGDHLSAIPDLAGVTTLLSRLSAARALLLDEITVARMGELDAANLPADIDTLLTRVTAAVALASVCTEARLAELDAANLPTDIAAIPTTAMRGTENAATAAALATVDTEVGQIKAITDAIGATAAANLAKTLGSAGIISGTVDNSAHTPTTTEFEADDITEATADHYKDRVILWLTGANAGQVNSISVYALAGANGHFTVSAMTEAPANNATFVII